MYANERKPYRQSKVYHESSRKSNSFQYSQDIVETRRDTCLVDYKTRDHFDLQNRYMMC